MLGIEVLLEFMPRCVVLL